ERLEVEPPVAARPGDGGCDRPSPTGDDQPDVEDGVAIGPVVQRTDQFGEASVGTEQRADRRGIPRGRVLGVRLEDIGHRRVLRRHQRRVVDQSGEPRRGRSGGRCSHHVSTLVRSQGAVGDRASCLDRDRGTGITEHRNTEIAVSSSRRPRAPWSGGSLRVGLRRRRVVAHSGVRRVPAGQIDQRKPARLTPASSRSESRAMTYYRRVGDVPPKRHTQFRRPDGGLYYEEVMGEEGFSSDESLLYHAGVPSAIVDSTVWELPDLRTEA